MNNYIHKYYQIFMDILLQNTIFIYIMLILKNLNRFLIGRIHNKTKKTIKHIAIFDNNIAKFKKLMDEVFNII